MGTKTRVISALIGLAILAVVLVLFGTIVLNAVIFIVSLIAVKELLTAMGCIKHRGLLVVSSSTAALLSTLVMLESYVYLSKMVFVVPIAYFFVAIAGVVHRSLRLGKVLLALVVSVTVPMFFACVIFFRSGFGVPGGIFYLLLALGAAWLCDTCAYFVGRKFGKRKLAPVISPKKTVEGAVGGVIGGMLLMLLVGTLYVFGLGLAGIPASLNYPALMLCLPVVSVLGILGDLCASLIKRHYGVKDYGNIMPGHGGILDRFDSVLFTLPSVYILAQYVEFIRI